MRSNGRGRPARSGTELGFTLIELTIVVAIIPLVVGAIAVALISVISQQTTLTNKVSDSQDAQIGASEFVKDVQSSTAVTVKSGVTSPTPCADTQNPQLDPILSLQVGSSNPPVVSYYVVPQPVQHGATFASLYRYRCFGGVTTRSVVASDVQTDLGNLSEPGNTSLSITGSSCSAQGCQSALSAAESQWAPAAGISRVSLDVTAKATSDTTFGYTLSGAPRVVTNAALGEPPPGHAPLTVLGGTVNCQNASLTVNGEANIETQQVPAITVGQGNVTASSIYTDTNPTTTGSFSAGSHGTYTIGNNPPQSNPPPTGNQTNLNDDPFAGLIPPSATALNLPTFTATETDPSIYGPGVYTGGISFPQSTFQLRSGVYIVENGGITGGGNMTVTTAPGGVLFYVEQGAVTITGGANTNVTLNPWTSSQSPAPNLLLWVDKNDTAAQPNVSLGGSPTAHAYNGTIYDPSGEVSQNGGSGAAFGSVIANSLSCGNGTPGTMTIGVSP